MAADIEDTRSARFALRCSNFAERWFPDSWVFAALAVIIVALATLAMGAKPTDAAMAFGDGFWSLIPFTMQMAFVVIGGYVVASSPPAVKLIDRLARIPKNGRSAVAWVALISMVASLLNWGLSLVFGGLLVRALARRTDLHMDYRAAGAAAYLGLGAVWALGLSSSAAQLQANPASQRLLGLILEDKGVLRSHMKVFTANGEGETTSGSFSPSLEKSIAFARLPLATQPDETVEVDIRGKRLKARTVKLPFVRNGKALI